MALCNDEQRNGGHRFHIFLASAVCNCLGKLIEQDVGFAIQHLAAFLNRSLSDGLRQVAFPRPAWTEKQSVLSFVDEGASAGSHGSCNRSRRSPQRRGIIGNLKPCYCLQQMQRTQERFIR